MNLRMFISLRKSPNSKYLNNTIINTLTCVKNHSKNKSIVSLLYFSQQTTSKDALTFFQLKIKAFLNDFYLLKLLRCGLLFLSDENKKPTFTKSNIRSNRHKMNSRHVSKSNKRQSVFKIVFARVYENIIKYFTKIKTKDIILCARTLNNVEKDQTFSCRYDSFYKS